jgi:AraC family transcriptional regulator
MSVTIHDMLSCNSTARAISRLDLGSGRSIAVWENQDAHVLYDAPRGNTFSLYLRGGRSSRRVDRNQAIGWTGAVCIMPEGHRSEWAISSQFRFVHLYLPDDKLRAAYARTHDRDARQLDLREEILVDAPMFATPLAQMAYAAETGDALMADAALAELVGHLPQSAPKLRGGLSPRSLRNVDEWIDANLDQQIRLHDLAQLAGLSEFHFHRMFRLSRGIAPHAWITARRCDLAKRMLRGAIPIAEIASACGFSNQSHLTRVFVRQTGLTPARYRALTMSHPISCLDEGS